MVIVLLEIDAGLKRAGMIERNFKYQNFRRLKFQYP